MLVLRLLLLVSICTVPAFSVRAAEAARPPEAGYETRAKRDRDGIGKFYFGREIAQVMGHQAASWLERPERETEERTDVLLRVLALQPGDVVADIGAGSGYFSWRMAQRVGEQGRVYAVDIQQEMLDLLAANMKRRQVDGIVRPIVGTALDPKLPPASVDLILLVDVYHEFDHPYEMTRAMAAALKPGGRLVLVEYRGEDPQVPIKPLHKMTVAQLRKEIAGGEHPLEFDRVDSALPRQHIVVFRRSR
jgi:precorrin-6B methylase 2